MFVFLRMICVASVNRMREGRERERERESGGIEERISIEFLLHGGAEHNSRGKTSIAILNTRMPRVDRQTDRQAGIGQAGRQL